MKKLFVYIYDSPCGPLLLGESSNAITHCDWLDGKHHKKLTQLCSSPAVQYGDVPSPLLTEAVRQIEGYFRGERREFDLPLATEGTPFQQRVWAALRTVPYGETLTYSELASRLGCPKAVRAVANAVGANPISILIPCHRIVGKNGGLTGYAGGLEAKKLLLQLEKPF